MNQPAGFTLNADGQVVDVRPLEVIFNQAFWYEAVHMFLAAYMVAGFTIAGVYAVGLLRGRRDRLHRLGMVIPLTVAAIATPL
jgi:cytochrome d ubiquinol oxidase subunit I